MTYCPRIESPLVVLALLSLVIAAPVAAAQAQAQAAAVAEDGGLERVQDFLEGATTLEAAFRQTLLDETGRAVQTASGVLAIKRPGRFRWDYSDPYKQQIVADGERLWVYDEDLEQVTVRALDESLAGTPATLLSGSSDIGAGYALRAHYEAEGLEWIVLAPREDTAGFVELRLGFAGDDLRAMELLDTLDQTTVIELQDLRRNVALADERFAFEPPPGTDVVGDPGPTQAGTRP